MYFFKTLLLISLPIAESTVLDMSSAGFIALHFQIVMSFIFTHYFQRECAGGVLFLVFF